MIHLSNTIPFRSVLASAAALVSFAMPTQAQQAVVKNIYLSKDRFFTQSSATQVALYPPDDLPFGFAAEVDGESRAAIANLAPRPTITLPGTSQFTAMYRKVPALGLGTDADDGWNFGYVRKKIYDNWGTRTKAELDSAFPNGNYTFRVQGRAITLSLPRDAYPPAPRMILSGGKWSGGKYYINPKLALTINSGTYFGYGTSLNNYIFLGMQDDFNGNVVFDGFQTAKKLLHGPPASLSKFRTYRVAPNTLVPGRTYFIFSGYGAVVSQSLSMPGAASIATFGSESEIEVVASAAP